MKKEIKTYFFDSYAFYELIKGNKNYMQYSKDIAIVTTKLNLMELHYGLISKFGAKVADKYYDGFIQFSVDLDGEMIKKANKFRHIMKKNKLSYVDCLGYMIAKSRNIKFLTGDKEFANMDNVEFVK